MAISKRKISNRKAAHQRSINRKSTGSRRIDIVLPPEKPLDAPPQAEKRIIHSPSVYHPPEFKKKHWRKKSMDEKREISAAQQRRKISLLEKKWRAVFYYGKYQKPDGSIPLQIGKQIALKFGYSLHQLKKFVQQALNGESFLRKVGGGRKRTIFDIANRSLREIFHEYGGELSQLTMTELVNRKGVKVVFSNSF